MNLKIVILNEVRLRKTNIRSHYMWNLNNSAYLYNIFIDMENKLTKVEGESDKSGVSD